MKPASVLSVLSGIGRPPGQMDPKAFLLQKFNASARERVSATCNLVGSCCIGQDIIFKHNMLHRMNQIDDALQEGVDVLKTLLTKGLTECASSTNTYQKYKHLRLQTLPV